MNVKNPLLEIGQLQFKNFKPKNIIAAVDYLLAKNRRELGKLLQQKSFTWDSLMRPLQEINNSLHIVWGNITHLHSVLDSPEIRKYYSQALPKISAYVTELGHNVKLFNAIKFIAEKGEYKKLDFAQKKVIDNELRDFKLAGVHLKPNQKHKFAKLQNVAAKLAAKFSENVLDATMGWSFVATKKSQLAGLPNHAIDTALIVAKSRKVKGWLFTLDAPSYQAVMMYADDRKLREKFYEAYTTIASDQGPNAGKWDNSKIMEEILQNRKERVKLLGYKNYAEYSLVTKTAKNPKQVMIFLHELLKYTRAKSLQELKELQAIARKDGVKDLRSWDVPYYSEKLKQQKYAINQEALRPYFPLPQVLQGLFNLTEKLYGIIFKEVRNFETWHKDVRVFALFKLGNLVGHLYMDFFPRPNKQNGAWMNDIRTRRRIDNKTMQTPIAYIVCNFSPPIKDKPSLLTHMEVTTLFHEFGHSLQQLLTKIDYPEVSGINGVPWDTVELASQFMENLAFEKKVLNLIARHYKTKKSLPSKLYNQMILAKNFQAALKMLRQLEYAIFDMRLHLEFSPNQKNQIQNILDQVRKMTSLIVPPSYNRFQNAFSHIFGGGYAAGYYSYKWAEVMAVDAYTKFKEEGIFNKKTALSFLHNILEMGGAVDPMILFKRFRGHKPDVKALLREDGIIN